MSLIHIIILIYLIAAIRIMLFKLRMIFRLYWANKQGYVNVRNNNQLIQVTLDKPIPILPFIGSSDISAEKFRSK